MFKTKLQEYCQSKAWLLPGYHVTREGGPYHCPLFKAVVQVNGVSFTSPDVCTTSKAAQNLAAKLAFEHFIGPEPIKRKKKIKVLPESSSKDEKKRKKKMKRKAH